MKKDFLLDSSFVIDLLDEAADGEPDPAMHWLERHGGNRMWVNAVTAAEVLEGAVDATEVRRHSQRYHWQGLRHAHAAWVTLIQRRPRARMGENDARQAAVVQIMNGAIVGHDTRAFARLGSRYIDHRALAER